MLAARMALRVERLAEDSAFADAVGRLVAGKVDPYAAADELLGDRSGR